MSQGADRALRARLRGACPPAAADLVVRAFDDATAAATTQGVASDAAAQVRDMFEAFARCLEDGGQLAALASRLLRSREGVLGAVVAAAALDGCATDEALACLEPSDALAVQLVADGLIVALGHIEAPVEVGDTEHDAYELSSAVVKPLRFEVVEQGPARLAASGSKAPGLWHARLRDLCSDAVLEVQVSDGTLRLRQEAGRTLRLRASSQPLPRRDWTNVRLPDGFDPATAATVLLESA